MAAVRRLHESRGRRATGCVLLEGPDALAAAISTRALVREVFVTNTASIRDAVLVESAARAGAQVIEVTEPVMAVLAQTQVPQGVVATCAWAPVPIGASMLPGSSCVVLESIADPGNAGTIIRTADAAGLAGVILTEGSVDPGNGKCIRASAGSIFNVAVSAGVPIEAALARARELGQAVVVTDAHGEQDVFAWIRSWSRSGGRSRGLCWVLGNEAHGVSAGVRDAADATVRIPIRGRAESLNVASAAAVCLYGALATGMED